MDYRVLAKETAVVDTSEQQREEYIEIPIVDLTKYHNAIIEKQDAFGFRKIAEVFCNIGPDVRVVSGNHEYYFRSNIFRTLVQNKVDWDNLTCFALRSNLLKG